MSSRSCALCEHYEIDSHTLVYYVDCLNKLTICFLFIIIIIIAQLQHETDSFIEQKKVWR